MTAERRDSGPWAPAPGARLLLGLAAVAVAFAAADTYVVVLALPDMMSSVGLAVDELQRAAPIVSGFLLGYVAMLPLIGRIADLRGRIPVLVGSLVVFALGSLVTAAAYDLPSMVAGRFLQGVGGGGLVPATLAMYAARAAATAASSWVRRDPISMHGRSFAAQVIRLAAEAIAESWLRIESRSVSSTTASANVDSTIISGE